MTIITKAPDMTDAVWVKSDKTSDTPRTDAVPICYTDSFLRMATLARTLERELAEATLRLSEAHRKIEMMQKTVSPDRNTQTQLADFLEYRAKCNTYGPGSRKEKAWSEWVRGLKTESAVYAYAVKLETAIKEHNDECDNYCGIGDQEGVRCQYRPYFPRRCPECMKDWKIDAALAQEEKP